MLKLKAWLYAPGRLLPYEVEKAKRHLRFESFKVFLAEQSRQGLWHASMIRFSGNLKYNIKSIKNY